MIRSLRFLFIFLYLLFIYAISVISVEESNKLNNYTLDKLKRIRHDKN